MNEKSLEQAVREKELYHDVKREYYLDFQKQEGIPVYTGFHFPDLKTLVVEPWPRMGGLGAYVNLFGEELLGDNYICEISPGQLLKPQRHMYEELVYVLSGRGATTFWSHEGCQKETFEWKEHSLFALPSNVRYQHFNGDNSKPARIFAKTSLPAVMQYFRGGKFIFQNDFTFDELGKKFYASEANIYNAGPPDYEIVWTANFIPDVRDFNKMTDHQSRGGGGRSVNFHLSGLVRLFAHMSDFPVGTYKKAHAHPPGRSIILITGKGHSILWQPGREDKKVKVDWHPGSLFGVALTSLQGECWYHQHFNTGSEPARYLVLHVNSPTLEDKHVQIEYGDENPEIRRIFESELSSSGLKSKMPPQCYTDRNYKWKG